MNVSRLTLGVFAIGVAVTFYVTALGYPDKAANMPLIYSIVVALFGAAIIGQECLGPIRRRRMMAGTDTPASPSDNSPSEQEVSATASAGQRKRWKAMLVFLLAAFYVYSISLLGYLLATVAFMVVALALIGHVSRRFALLGIAVLVAVVCLVFIGFLGLPVPLLPPILS
ncbi:tripartite tricarboxylate transporter TctB family protein [Billgrantia bachuensis]|uniref:Tripartite tricarboxylate transporter TctB family protein n=1 Tax=Billgrantia bachuensis TaxID=2717286 RepID=A0ABX0PX69_9GAMM|nr:tripartite tricarboxylate transporter TctB family protein [Halomonas bachuensis]NIC07141.1 tripartite tricarboxylate transporter TctB family protein [Halomonas bachuensis]